MFHGADKDAPANSEINLLPEFPILTSLFKNTQQILFIRSSVCQEITPLLQNMTLSGKTDLNLKKVIAGLQFTQNKLTLFLFYAIYREPFNPDYHFVYLFPATDTALFEIEETCTISREVLR